jgi:hypothetical protein
MVKLSLPGDVGADEPSALAATISAVREPTLSVLTASGALGCGVALGISVTLGSEGAERSLGGSLIVGSTNAALGPLEIRTTRRPAIQTSYDRHALLRQSAG